LNALHRQATHVRVEARQQRLTCSAAGDEFLPPAIAVKRHTFNGGLIGKSCQLKRASKLPCEILNANVKYQGSSAANKHSRHRKVAA
jgi:hypothetical protein